MTNKEMYEKIFGMPVEDSNCPTSDCNVCPCSNICKDDIGISIACTSARVYEWWNEEYKDGTK